MALGSHVNESFLAYQFILYSKCVDGKEDWNLESGRPNLNLKTLGFQGSSKEKGVETNYCYTRISDLNLIYMLSSQSLLYKP